MTNQDQSHAQLNTLREAYIDGDLNHRQFADQLEQALEHGPDVGQDDYTATQKTGLDAVTTTISGIWMRLLVAYVNWKSDTSKQYDYDWGRHLITAVNTDPAPDTHPAEAAGKQQALFIMAPWAGWAALAVAIMEPAPLLGLLLLIPYWMSFIAPNPTVDCKASGLGRHIAAGGDA